MTFSLDLSLKLSEATVCMCADIIDKIHKHEKEKKKEEQKSIFKYHIARGLYLIGRSLCGASIVWD